MTRLETERLILRNFEADDWPALQEMTLQFESSAYAAYDYAWPTSAEEIRNVAEWFARGERFLAVCLKPAGRLIGSISLTPTEEPGCVTFDLGYRFNLDHHGKGYATEGCRAVIDHAFRQLGADRVASGTAAANQPSCRLLQRLGMTKRGEGTASFRKTPEGKPIEFVDYSFAITREEWLRRISREEAHQSSS
jgi:[ribosomal protein S5]-alanine N-acetyltransferase